MNKSIILYKAHDARFANHENSLYENLEQLIRKHVVKNSTFDVCFVKNNPDIENNFYDETTHTYWVAADENYSDGLRHKILESLKYFFVKNNTYSNVFITNLSTVVNTNCLRPMLSKNVSCQSVKGYYSWKHPGQKHVDYYFPSGAGTLLTRETVAKILDFSETKNLNVCPNFDDTFLGYALYHLNLHITELKRIDVLSKEDCARHLRSPKFLEYPHIRIKTDPRDKNIELKTHEFAYNAIYGESI